MLKNDTTVKIVNTANNSIKWRLEMRMPIRNILCVVTYKQYYSTVQFQSKQKIFEVVIGFFRAFP